jgi:hypothetical protein
MAAVGSPPAKSGEFRLHRPARAGEILVKGLKNGPHGVWRDPTARSPRCELTRQAQSWAHCQSQLSARQSTPFSQAPSAHDRSQLAPRQVTSDAQDPTPLQETVFRTASVRIREQLCAPEQLRRQSWPSQDTVDAHEDSPEHSSSSNSTAPPMPERQDSRPEQVTLHSPSQMT